MKEGQGNQPCPSFRSWTAFHLAPPPSTFTRPAPAGVLKQPDIFCWSFTIRRSRSEPLLSNGTPVSAMKRKTSSRRRCKRLTKRRGVGVEGLSDEGFEGLQAGVNSEITHNGVRFPPPSRSVRPSRYMPLVSARPW